MWVPNKGGHRLVPGPIVAPPPDFLAAPMAFQVLEAQRVDAEAERELRVKNKGSAGKFADGGEARRFPPVGDGYVKVDASTGRRGLPVKETQWLPALPGLIAEQVVLRGWPESRQVFELWKLGKEWTPAARGAVNELIVRGLGPVPPLQRALDDYVAAYQEAVAAAHYTDDESTAPWPPSFNERVSGKCVVLLHRAEHKYFVFAGSVAVLIGWEKAQDLARQVMHDCLAGGTPRGLTYELFATAANNADQIRVGTDKKYVEWHPCRGSMGTTFHILDMPMSAHIEVGMCVSGDSGTLLRFPGATEPLRARFPAQVRYIEGDVCQGAFTSWNSIVLHANRSSLMNVTVGAEVLDLLSANADRPARSLLSEDEPVEQVRLAQQILRFATKPLTRELCQELFDKASSWLTENKTRIWLLPHPCHTAETLSGVCGLSPEAIAAVSAYARDEREREAIEKRLLLDFRCERWLIDAKRFLWAHYPRDSPDETWSYIGEMFPSFEGCFRELCVAHLMDTAYSPTRGVLEVPALHGLLSRVVALFHVAAYEEQVLAPMTSAHAYAWAFQVPLQASCTPLNAMQWRAVGFDDAEKKLVAGEVGASIHVGYAVAVARLFDALEHGGNWKLRLVAGFSPTDPGRGDGVDKAYSLSWELCPVRLNDVVRDTLSGGMRIDNVYGWTRRREHLRAIVQDAMRSKLDQRDARVCAAFLGAPVKHASWRSVRSNRAIETQSMLKELKAHATSVVVPLVGVADASVRAAALDLLGVRAQQVGDLLIQHHTSWQRIPAYIPGVRAPATPDEYAAWVAGAR